MTRLKCISKTLVLLLIPLLVVSCGSLNFFDTSAEPPETQPSETQLVETENPKLDALEKQVSDMEQALVEQTAQGAEKNRRIEGLNRKIQSLEQKISKLENRPVPPSQKKIKKVNYTDPETLYKKARNLLVEEQYAAAAAHFSTFINDHPEHGLADNAVYWLGECHYSEGSFQQAVFVFKSLVKKYPKSEKVPDALLKTGYSYLAIDDTNRAHHFLKQVIKRYPFSPATEKAQEKLGEFN